MDRQEAALPYKAQVVYLENREGVQQYGRYRSNVSLCGVQGVLKRGFVLLLPAQIVLIQ